MTNFEYLKTLSDDKARHEIDRWHFEHHEFPKDTDRMVAFIAWLTMEHKIEVDEARLDELLSNCMEECNGCCGSCAFDIKSKHFDCSEENFKKWLMNEDGE